jgi:transcriptional regulator with XRE-family HTH domain
MDAGCLTVTAPPAHQDMVGRRRYPAEPVVRPALRTCSRLQFGPDPTKGFAMTSEYAKALGSRLRAIRTQQGLSLHGVEEKSKGRWKAVVVGSYERGDRAVTVQRLAELAEFYGVPIAELLPEGTPNAATEPPPRLVIDLERLHTVESDDRRLLARYAATIQSQRGDYNGRVLSIRQDDLRTLAVMYDESPSQLAEQLIDWGVLNADARSPVADAG